MLDEALSYGEARDSHHLAAMTIEASQRVVSGELLRPFSVIPFRWWDWHGHGEPSAGYRKSRSAPPGVSGLPQSTARYRR
jgi:hypothetical protein